MHRVHKQLEEEHKKLGSDFDRQQEKLKEVRTELAKKTETLTEEQTRVVATAKMLEDVAQERMESTKKHYYEVERAKMVLDKLQTTYQHQVIEYEGQEQAVAAVIQKLRNERQVAEDIAKFGVEWIRSMVTAWRNQTKIAASDNTANTPRGC